MAVAATIFKNFRLFIFLKIGQNASMATAILLKMESILGLHELITALLNPWGDRRLAIHPPPFVHLHQLLLVAGPLTLPLPKATLVFFLGCEVSLLVLRANGLLVCCQTISDYAEVYYLRVEKLYLQ